MGHQDFLSKIFCLTVSKDFVRYPSVLCLRKLTIAKKIMKERGESKFSLENSLSHSAENFPRRNPLVFHYFRVSKTNYASECYVSISSRDFCCLTQPKNFLGEPFCAVFHIFYGSEKDYE